MTPYELAEVTNYTADLHGRRGIYCVRLRTNELAPRELPQVSRVTSLIRLIRGTRERPAAPSRSKRMDRGSTPSCAVRCCTTDLQAYEEYQSQLDGRHHDGPLTD